MNQTSPRVFNLGSHIATPVMRSLWKLVEPPVERLLSLSAVNDVYARTLQLRDELERPDRGAHGTSTSYFADVLDVLRIGYDLSHDDWEQIPREGPIVVVANHPFGAADGVVLGDILARRRPDMRLLGNHLLYTVPELRPSIIPVDPFGGEAAVRNNVRPLKASLKWLRAGGALGVFPGGAVSQWRVREGRVVDPTWHPSVAALVRHAGATVVPVFFEGRNSALFHLAGLLHAGLRTALIPSELMRRSDSRLQVRIGRPIGPDKWSRYADDETLTSYLRWKTHMLARRQSPVRPRFPGPPRPDTSATTSGAAPIAPPGDVAEMTAEVLALPAETLLCEQGDFQVFICEATAIPKTLHEIGRQREIAFRAVDEGTGRPIDLDRYDNDYLHLFMWNRTKQEIVGSYRIGCVDELLARAGVAGLYTSSLFKFRAGFIQRLGSTLELGRSFICQEYQRKPLSLALLWRGIGEFLVRNPRYKVLFGPVSISRCYDGRSVRIMVEALSRKRGDEALSALVKARNPPRDKPSPDECDAIESLVKDVDDISTLVAEIEADNKGMPVLLRHYLRLGARLLSFNVDRSFGNCIDGLIVVDVRQCDPKLLVRFMGQDGHRRYVAAGG